MVMTVWFLDSGSESSTSPYALVPIEKNSIQIRPLGFDEYTHISPQRNPQFPLPHSHTTQLVLCDAAPVAPPRPATARLRAGAQWLSLLPIAIIISISSAPLCLSGSHDTGTAHPLLHCTTTASASAIHPAVPAHAAAVLQAAGAAQDPAPPPIPIPHQINAAAAPLPAQQPHRR